MKSRLNKAYKGFVTLWQPITDRNERERRNNLTTGLIICNLIFCVIAGACWASEIQSKVEDWPYISFYVGEVIIILIHRFNTAYSRTWPRSIARTFGVSPSPEVAELVLVPSGAGAPSPLLADDPPQPGAQTASLEGMSFPLQAIGVLNAALVGFLTYYTGGPSNSPYAQVLVAMLLIAEQTRDVKGHHENRLRRMISMPIREFRWFFALIAMFYVPLGILQWRAPVDVPTAPAGATILITATIFLVGSVANFITGSEP